MSRYHGRHGTAYISTSGATSAQAVVGLSKWSLDRTTDLVDVTAFGDGNKVYVQGLPDSKLQISGFWDANSSDTLFSAAASTTAVNVYLYPSSDDAAVYWYGTFWLNASMSTDVKGAVEVSANGAAAGPATFVG